MNNQIDNNSQDHVHNFVVTEYNDVEEVLSCACGATKLRAHSYGPTTTEEPIELPDGVHSYAGVTLEDKEVVMECTNQGCDYKKVMAYDGHNIIEETVTQECKKM